MTAPEFRPAAARAAAPHGPVYYAWAEEDAHGFPIPEAVGDDARTTTIDGWRVVVDGPIVYAENPETGDIHEADARDIWTPVI